MRFERMTYGLEGSCSIQLSYECIKGSGWEDFLFSSRFLLRGVELGLARWAERVCARSGEARSADRERGANTNREGVASGSATQNFIILHAR